MTSLKASTTSYLAQMNNKRVKRTITGIMTVDDIPEMRKNIIKIVKEQGHLESDITETENHFEFSFSNQVIFKPKFIAEETGTLEVRSKDLVFIPDDTEQRKYSEKRGFSYAPDAVKIEKLIHPTKGGLLTYELI